MWKVSMLSYESFMYSMGDRRRNQSLSKNPIAFLWNKKRHSLCVKTLVRSSDFMTKFPFNYTLFVYLFSLLISAWWVSDGNLWESVLAIHPRGIRTKQTQVFRLGSMLPFSLIHLTLHTNMLWKQTRITPRENKAKQNKNIEFSRLL